VESGGEIVVASGEDKERVEAVEVGTPGEADEADINTDKAEDAGVGGASEVARIRIEGEKRSAEMNIATDFIATATALSQTGKRLGPQI
jgi:hypothetical protein